MVTAKGDESDIVSGLELGADDYITKPFSMKILIARINTAFRRSKKQSPEQNKIIKIKDLIIDQERHSVHINQKPVEMTFTEFSLLHYLAGRPGRVMSRDQIIDAVRGEDYAVTDRAVDVQIVGLRKKLGKYSNLIQTVRGVGYRFKETGDI
jgi:two-component system phosphate regulon response regulator PhoB